MENENVIFSTSDYEEMVQNGQLTREEADMLMQGDAIVEQISLIGDPAEVMSEYEKAVPENSKNALEQTLKLAETNPKLFVRLMSLVDLADAKVEPVATTNPRINALSDEEYKTFAAKLFTEINSWSAEKKAEFAKVLENRTPEQEDELIKNILGK